MRVTAVIKMLTNAFPVSVGVLEEIVKITSDDAWIPIPDGRVAGDVNKKPNEEGYK